MGSSTYFGESHLDFIQLPLEKGRKMHTYEVMNTKFDYVIGKIHWRGGWRQYVFQAIFYDEETSDYEIKVIDDLKYIPLDAITKIDMSRSCNNEINKFIDKLMKEWKDSLKKRNTNIPTKTEKGK